MSLQGNKPEVKPLTWYAVLLAGAAAFGSFLAVKKFIFGDPIDQQSIITGSVCSITLMIAFFIMNKKAVKKQNENQKKNENE